MASVPAGFMFNTPHSQGLLHKAWELFIEYLAHSSFKDFAPANCFYWGINYEFHSSKYSVRDLREFRCLTSTFCVTSEELVRWLRWDGATRQIYYYCRLFCSSDTSKFLFRAFRIRQRVSWFLAASRFTVCASDKGLNGIFGEWLC